MSDGTWTLCTMLAKQSFGLSLATKKGRRQILIYILMAVVLIPQAFVMYIQYESLIGAGMTQMALETGLTLGCMLCSLLLVFTFPAELYFSSDLPMLLSLPLKPQSIILAKTMVIALYQLPFALLCGLPLVLACALSGAMAWWQLIVLALECILVPASAILILGIATILIMQFLPFFNNRDRYNLIIGIVMIFAAVAISLLSSSMGASQSSGQLPTQLPAMTSVFFQIVPAVSGILQPSGVWLLVSLAVPLLLAALYAWCADRFYLKAALASTSAAPRRIRSGQEKQPRTTFDAFFLTDLRRLMRTPAFVTNNVLGTFLLPIMFTAMFLLLPQMKEAREIFGDFDLDGSLRQMGIYSGCLGLAAGILLTLMFGNMNSIAGTAISREGEKGVQWMKSVPVSLQAQLNAKLLTAFMFSMLGMVLMLIPMFILIRLPLAFVLSYLAGCALTCLVTNQVALIGDIRFPKLNWTSEAAAVKNNFGPVLEIFAFMALALVSIWLLVEFAFSGNGMVFNIVCSVMGIVFLILALLLWKVPAWAFERWL